MFPTIYPDCQRHRRLGSWGFHGAHGPTGIWNRLSRLGKSTEVVYFLIISSVSLCCKAGRATRSKSKPAQCTASQAVATEAIPDSWSERRANGW